MGSNQRGFATVSVWPNSWFSSLAATRWRVVATLAPPPPPPPPHWYAVDIEMETKFTFPSVASVGRERQWNKERLFSPGESVHPPVPLIPVQLRGVEGKKTLRDNHQ